MGTQEDTGTNLPQLREVIGQVAARNIVRLRKIFDYSLTEAAESTSLTPDMINRQELGKRIFDVGALAELAKRYKIPTSTIITPWIEEDVPDGYSVEDIRQVVFANSGQEKSTSLPHIELLTVPTTAIKPNARTAVLTSSDGLKALAENPSPETLAILIDRQLINDFENKINIALGLTNTVKETLSKLYKNSDFVGKYYYALVWQTHSRAMRDTTQAFANAPSSYPMPRYLQEKREQLELTLKPNDLRFQKELETLKEKPEFKELLLEDQGQPAGWMMPIVYLFEYGYFGRPHPKI